jgi:O-antigen/teichoic acid export membrane protein
MESVSRQFVPLFFGKGFEKCIILFQILLPCCSFLAFANVIRTQYLIPQKKDKEYIISLFAGAGVNVIANYILISRIQSIGASIGTLLAEIVVCLVQAYLMKDELDSLHHFIQIIPFVISGLIMYIIWEPINLSFLHSSVLPLFAKIVGGGITYLLALFVSLSLWDRLIGLDVDYKMMITSMISRFKINN